MRAAAIVPGRDGGDRDWRALRAAFERRLDPGNFADDGSQRRRLSDLRSGAG